MSVILRSIFNLFLYLLFLISGGNVSIMDIDSGLSLALITVSIIIFCLVSIWQTSVSEGLRYDYSKIIGSENNFGNAPDDNRL